MRVSTAVLSASLLGLAGWFALGMMTSVESKGVAAVADAAPIVVASASEPVSDSAAGSDDGPAPAARASGIAGLADAEWIARTSAATGIPSRVLRGYAGAELAMASEDPGCRVRWATLAALGDIESAHGTHAGSAVGDDGVTRPGIFGIDLTGEASARISDTDGGLWDGRVEIDRAVGPMQFIPATWQTWGADGNADGARDPQNIDDAALATARYLCHHGDLGVAENWRTAIFAYNHLDTYVEGVAERADAYAAAAGR